MTETADITATVQQAKDKLEGLHSILDSGLQNLKESVFSSSMVTAGAPAADARMTLQNLETRSQRETTDLQSASSSTSSKRRNSNLRKLLSEIKTGEAS